MSIMGWRAQPRFDFRVVIGQAGGHVRPPYMAQMRPILLPVLLACALGLIWEVGTRIANVSSMIIVPPSAIGNVISATFPILMQQSVTTVRESIYGFMLASFVGLFMGSALFLSRRIRQAIYPYVLVFQLIPKVALAPLFIVWFGVGPTSRLLLAAFMGFFPVVIATVTGLMSADSKAMRMADSLTASPWQIFCCVQAPYAVPHIFSGLKIGLSMAIIGVFIGEFITGQSGLGYVIMLGTSSANTALAFASITLLAILGLVLYGAVALAEWLTERRMGVSITSDEF